MTTQELIDYYTGLLIMQYSAGGNAVATVQAIMYGLIQEQIVQKVGDGFDLDTAIGVQLTAVGTYRGAPRVVFGIVPGNYWSLVPYADPLPNSYFGWALYADPDPTWKWIQYADLDAFGTPLTDIQLRRLIRFLALTSSSDLTLGDLDNILYATFGIYVNVVDNKDMTITYDHTAADPDPDGLWGIVVLANALPHPAGVAFSVVEV